MQQRPNIFQNAQALAHIVDLARRVPPAATTMKFVVEDTDVVRCQCDKRMLITDMPLRDSGVVRYRDNACLNCPNVDKRWAVLICVRCVSVVARMEPTGPDPVDGFSFAARQQYHVMACSVCQPDITSVVPIERVIWRQRNPSPIRSHHAK